MSEKDKHIKILEKRIEDAYDNGCKNYEKLALINAIHVINDFVPPECFDEYVIKENKRELLKFAKFADKSPHLLIFDILNDYLRESK